MSFECKKCGKCCSNFLPLTKKDVERIKKVAKTENVNLLDKEWYQTCPFLNNKKLCDIYEDRPTICREFTCYAFENGIYSKELLRKAQSEEFNLVDLRETFFSENYKGGTNE